MTIYPHTREVNPFSSTPLGVHHSKIIPYLEQIDCSRYYSNGGPLVLEYERRLSQLFSPKSLSPKIDDSIGALATSSCTSALTACIMALNLPQGSFIACPSWTFIATPAAIVAAGHIPYFVDVAEHDWTSLVENKCRAAIAVSAFGAPLDMDLWNRVNEKKPVIIDAAAGFDTFSTVRKPGKCPVVISTHATKIFSTGEGGIVLSCDKEYLDAVRSICNFGFIDNPGAKGAQRNNREALHRGLNAKMSEYAAAVGLATLEQWCESGLRSPRVKWKVAKFRYCQAFHDITELTPVMDNDWVSSCFPVRLKVPAGYSGEMPYAAKIAMRLEALGINCRQSWGMGCHGYAAYVKYPRTDMSVTNKLAGSTLMLPINIDATQSAVDYIRSSLLRAIA